MPVRRVPGARPEALFQPPPERQPLAARMRPRTFAEFEGQEHLVGENGPLRRSVARGKLTSLLLWGPPGTGKTTLARILAEAIGADFVVVSAVMSGVAEIRAAIAAAEERLVLNGHRTVIVIDEAPENAELDGMSWSLRQRPANSSIARRPTMWSRRSRTAIAAWSRSA